MPKARKLKSRCSVPACGNFARTGSPFCAVHKHQTARGSTSDIHQPPSASLEERERHRTAVAIFKARLDAGDYRGLFGQKLGQVMQKAAADAGVQDEIAVLRIVMARLMAEVEDPIELAHAVARVASVSVQAARAQRAITGKVADALTEAFTALLIELTPGGER
jgi:hypothetical protein